VNVIKNELSYQLFIFQGKYHFQHFRVNCNFQFKLSRVKKKLEIRSPYISKFTFQGDCYGTITQKDGFSLLVIYFIDQRKESKQLVDIKTQHKTLQFQTDKSISHAKSKSPGS
jgi:hypothetical protein